MVAAVQNRYANSLITGNAVNKALEAINSNGLPIKCLIQNVAFDTATDANGSIYRVFKSLPVGIIPLALLTAGDADAGLDMVDFGFYKPDLSVAEVKTNSKYALAHQIDISAAKTSLLEGTAINCMPNVTVAQQGKGDTLWDIIWGTDEAPGNYSGSTPLEKLDAVDLCMTLDGDAPAAAGNKTVMLLFLNN